jgi:3-oxoadipate enol-lactonase
MRFKLSNGLSIAYRTRGVGRTIVLLHPVGVRGAFWDDVVRELESDYRLIVPDARGHGDSDASSKPFDLDDLASDIAELLRAVGHPPAVVVGCSMGGMVAQAIACNAPDLVRGFVVANTAHRRDDQGRATMEQRALQAEKGMAIVLPTTLSRWFDAPTMVAKPELVARARDWLLEADPVIHAWSWRAIRGLNYSERLKSVPMPALAIAGLRDQSTPVSAMQAMAKDIPGCAYREIDSGHLAPLEEPVQFAALLREFVAGLA